MYGKRAGPLLMEVTSMTTQVQFFCVKCKERTGSRDV